MIPCSIAIADIDSQESVCRSAWSGILRLSKVGPADNTLLSASKSMETLWLGRECDEDRDKYFRAKPADRHSMRGTWSM